MAGTTMAPSTPLRARTAMGRGLEAPETLHPGARLLRQRPPPKQLLFQATGHFPTRLLAPPQPGLFKTHLVFERASKIHKGKIRFGN